MKQTFNDAVSLRAELLTDALERMRRWRAGDHSAATINMWGLGPDEAGDEVRYSFLEQMFLDTLIDAETVFCSSEIAAAIWQASQTLPDWMLDRNLLLCPSGFCWLEDVIGLPPEPDAPMFDGLMGFGWHDVTINGQPPATLPATLTITFLLRDQSGSISRLGRPVLWHRQWAYGRSWATPNAWSEPSEEAGRRRANLDRFFGAFMAFCSQHILVTDQARANRAVRRRLEREAPDLAEGLVRVVRLRRLRQRTPPRADDSEQEAVAWSCRWLVRGHWRQQWYPSTGVHQPKFIEPYVKGPEDRPLRPPRTPVFAVVR